MGLPKSQKMSEEEEAAAKLAEAAEAAQAKREEEAEEAEKKAAAESKRLAKELEDERAENTKAAAKLLPKNEGEALLVANAKHPDARLKTVKHDSITCPYTGVTVTSSGTARKVPVSNWMKCQIEAGILEVVED